MPRNPLDSELLKTQENFFYPEHPVKEEELACVERLEKLREETVYSDRVF